MWEKRRQTYKKYPILNNLDGIITTDQAIKPSKVDKNLTKLFRSTWAENRRGSKDKKTGNCIPIDHFTLTN